MRSTDSSVAAPSTTLATGIPALDDVFGGGLEANRLYLVQGTPGTGKTTLALQFALEGRRVGESVLYVSLSETSEELRLVAASHGWSLEGITLHELVPSEQSLEPAEQYTLFHPAEVELSDTIGRILREVDRTQPTRAVIDSLSEMRLLAGNPLRFRRHVLALKQFFTSRNCTVLFLDDESDDGNNQQVRSIAHGVLKLEQIQTEYGVDRRRLRVVKFRGRSFRGGFHDFAIRRGGLDVFPRLVAAEHRRERPVERLSSGIPEFDALLGGGVERGTSTLLVGAAGTGKSTLAAHFVTAAAERGQRAAMFLFDESVSTLLSRTDGLGIALRPQFEAGNVTVQPVDPAELSPGEFVHAVREQVEANDAAIVVIDSLNGYLNAMPGERYLTIQLHELLMYLGQRHVASVLVGAHQGLVGSAMTSPVDASYLADAVILLRYFEAEGELHQAISVVKKRGGAHERSIREMRLGAGGVHVGAPLRNFRGVLSGLPVASAPVADPNALADR